MADSVILRRCAEGRRLRPRPVMSEPGISWNGRSISEPASKKTESLEGFDSRAKPIDFRGDSVYLNREFETVRLYFHNAADEAMGYQLENWEVSFNDKLESLDATIRHKAGALLPLIPDREEWTRFLATVQSEWGAWEHDLNRCPACLVVLYGGLAFYEYEERQFWPHFARSTGKELIPPNEQTEINQAFSRAAEHLGFRILRKVSHRTLKLLEIELPVEDSTTSYVGSAVYQVGIPLSFWDGFLEICEWASWQDNWNALSDEDWAHAVNKRTGGRTRLSKFLIDNRKATTDLINEVLEARKILSSDKDLAISDISQACFLRREYFDEVPETAEFLRPKDPESLLRDRAQLVWSDGHVCLRLPGVPAHKLPATWQVDKNFQPAATTPRELILNSSAFQPSINLRLVSGSNVETQKLHGISPWGLFDLDSGGRLVSSGREQLPLHSYILVSPNKIEAIDRKGFEETDNPSNDPFQLADGTTCFVTYLWPDPNRKFTELSLSDGEQVIKLRFRPHSRIESRFFVGREHRAANFDRIVPDKLKIEHLPVLCLAIPFGYFEDVQTALHEKFHVLVDEQSAFGKWEKSEAQLSEERECFVWNWHKRPLLQKKRSGTLKNFRELDHYLGSPDLKGDRVLSIQSPEFSVTYKVRFVHPKHGMDECWKELPGNFLPWFLLCQSHEGMKWEDLMLAHKIIAPDLQLSAYLLRKCEKEGLLIQKGRRWIIAESRATVTAPRGDECLLQYCGNPSILWGLYRRMSYIPRCRLPIVKVINRRGEIPYLQTIWEQNQKLPIEEYLRRKGVSIRHSLWNH